MIDLFPARRMPADDGDVDACQRPLLRMAPVRLPAARPERCLFSPASQLGLLRGYSSVLGSATAVVIRIRATSDRSDAASVEAQVGESLE